MGVKFEASKLIWILINEDAEESLVNLIAAGLESFKTNSSNIKNLCKKVTDDKKEALNYEQIDNFLEKTITSFVDNHKDLGDLLVYDTGDQMSDQIRTQLGNDKVVLERAIDDILNQISRDSPEEQID